MKFYLHSLTAGQQGGIGWPPVIVRLIESYKGRKIYGISNSREKKVPKDLNQFFEYPSMFTSLYSHIKNPEWRSQQWCLTWWHKAPQITWNKLIQIIKEDE